MTWERTAPELADVDPAADCRAPVRSLRARTTARGLAGRPDPEDRDAEPPSEPADCQRVGRRYAEPADAEPAMTCASADYERSAADAGRPRARSPASLRSGCHRARLASSAPPLTTPSRAAPSPATSSVAAPMRGTADGATPGSCADSAGFEPGPTRSRRPRRAETWFTGVGPADSRFADAGRPTGRADAQRDHPAGRLGHRPAHPGPARVGAGLARAAAGPGLERVSAGRVPRAGLAGRQRAGAAGRAGRARPAGTGVRPTWPNPSARPDRTAGRPAGPAGAVERAR